MDAIWPKGRDLDTEVMETRGAVIVGPWQMLIFLPGI
jgi:hypothetical protein